MVNQPIVLNFEAGILQLEPFLRLLKTQLEAQGLNPRPHDEDEIQDEYVGYKFKRGTDRCSLGI